MNSTPNANNSASRPAVSSHAVERLVTSMAKVGACWSPSFSPDGRQLAFCSTLNGIPQVWTVSAQSGWPMLVTSLDDQILSVSWSPDGEWLAFNLAPGGGMNQQIYIVRPDGRDLRRLTDGGKENNRLVSWIRTGGKVNMASNRRNPHTVDAYLYDIETDQMDLVVQNQGIGFMSDISQDGQYAVAYRMENRSDDNLFLVNIGDGTETLLTPHEGPGNFTNGTFSPDGQTIYLAANRNRELLAFCQIRIDADDQPGPIEVLAERNDAELQEFSITDDGQTAALVWNVAGRSELEFMDLASREIMAGPTLPADVAMAATFSRDGERLAMVLSGAASPLDIYVFDRQDDRLWQVTHSPRAGIAIDRLVRPELVRFTAHDGLELSGWLYRPLASDGAGPAVLSFHGGPEGQEVPFFSSNYQSLLLSGIAVFAPNVHGSGGFGKTFVNLDNGALCFDAIRDIKTCVDYVVSAGVADPKRIGIMGGSYGGYMTIAGLTHYPALFAAGANLFGIVNFETFFEHTEPWMAEISKIEYGDPETERELLRELSPIHKLNRVNAPTIVLHGANDTNVPVVEAEQVVENLEKRGVPVKYILFPDEGHGFNKEPNRIRATVEVTQWFVEHLG